MVKYDRMNKSVKEQSYTELKDWKPNYKPKERLESLMEALLILWRVKNTAGRLEKK